MDMLTSIERAKRMRHIPVPKCLPMKKTMGGIRKKETRLESAGNADAGSQVSFSLSPYELYKGRLPNSEAVKMINMATSGPSSGTSLSSFESHGDWAS